MPQPAYRVPWRDTCPQCGEACGEDLLIIVTSARVLLFFSHSGGVRACQLVIYVEPLLRGLVVTAV